MELDLFPLMGKVASGGVFWCVCELSITLGSLLAEGCVSATVLLVAWHGAFSTAACRRLGGAGSWC